MAAVELLSLILTDCHSYALSNESRKASKLLAELRHQHLTYQRTVWTSQRRWRRSLYRGRSQEIIEEREKRYVLIIMIFVCCHPSNDVAAALMSVYQIQSGIRLPAVNLQCKCMVLQIPHAMLVIKKMMMWKMICCNAWVASLTLR